MTRPSTTSPRTPMDIGSNRQLFIDDLLVDAERTTNAALSLNLPRTTRKVLAVDRPWETLTVGGHGTVLDEGPVYRLYYLAMDLDMGLHFEFAGTEVPR
ncbi:MAG: hypothetical protein HY318_09215 [Armatimonadetes bacterium]|nr:hypothetical protein [Armatimonadota bacterium]